MCAPVAPLALGGLAAYANRDKLKSGWNRLTRGVGKVTDKVADWSDNNLKIG